MNLTLKKILVTILTVFMLFSATMFFTSVVKADDTNADMTFEMVAGASLRLDADHNGIRYQAKVGADFTSQFESNEDAYFGMIVIPKSYLDYAKNYENLVEGLIEKIPAANLWNLKGMEVYNGYLNGVVSNIIYDNFNVQRLAIAYYFDGTTYNYPTNYMDTLRSVGEVVDSALRNIETFMADPYTEESRKVLYGFNYLADSQNANLAKPTDEEVLAFASSCTFNEEINLINFDGEINYAPFIKKTSVTSADDANFNWHPQNGSTEVTTFDGAEVLKINPPSSRIGGGAIAFTRGVTVTKDTAIKVKLYFDGDTYNATYPVSFFAYKLGASAKRDNMKRLLGTSDIKKWMTVEIKAQDIGYSVGDVMSGIQFFADKLNALYIDSIELIQYPVLEENELINFDGKYVDYSSNLVKASFNDGTYSYYANLTSREVVEGVATFTHNGNNILAGAVKFNKTLTVSENTTLTIRMYFTGTAYDGQGMMFFLAKFGTNNSGDSNYRKGKLTGSANGDNQWVDCKVKATDIGYNVGDTLTGIEFCAKNCQKIEIDYITTTLDPVLVDNQVINFDGKFIDYSSNLPKATFTDSGFYGYYAGVCAKNVLNSGDDGYEKYGTGTGIAHFTGSNNINVGAVKFNKSVIVTDSTKVEIRMYFEGEHYDGKGAYFFLAKLGANNNGDSGLFRNGNFTTNTWVNVTVNATDIGYNVGDTITGFEFCARNCTALCIDYISVS